MAKIRKQPKWFDEYVPEEVANSTLFKFEVTTGRDQAGNDQKISVDMRADLDVDYHLVQDQLEDTPSEFAYWAAIFSELKMQVAKIERMVKTRRARLIDEAMKNASAAQVKMTDKQTQAIIEADADLNKLELRLMLANKHAGKMYYMIEAIKMKSDNLRSLAGFARQEMATQK